MNFRVFIYTTGVFFLLGFNACKTDNSAHEETVVEKPKLKVPSFNKDSAYVFIEKQLSFGTRVPGSEGHKMCKEWLIKKFESYNAEVISQDFTASLYTGENLAASNIIAQFNKDLKDRIILSAHWDSRFMGEEDDDNSKKELPILAADDGGSGVGILLEVARHLSDNNLDIGVDIILWDAEDQGQRGGGPGADYTWCLGSQYWSKNKHKNKYIAKYGINLDMVGAKNPHFGKDQISMQYAGKVMNKVWKLAQTMGYSDMFYNYDKPGITDDHTMVNRIAGIPMIDIINQPLNTGNSFVKHWHTHDDNMDIIDKRTLKVVGQVLLATVFKESDGSIKAFE
jgi:Zn-dependent M28 family amino/carboxypeptidase